jgi:RHS repeat-associated protein
LGTPLEASNDGGEVTWRVTYRAWGNVVAEEAAEIEQKVRFQGQYCDLETGLHYNRFRYYEPSRGSFCSQDPIGLLGGQNQFQYGPNAINFIDPWGLVYHGPKPKYTNPGHHDPSSGSFRGSSGGRKTSVLPCHHETLAKKSVPDAEGKHWYAVDDKGVVHRFGNSNDGTMHWNGDSVQNGGIPVPADVKKRLDKMVEDGVVVPTCACHK